MIQTPNPQVYPYVTESIVLDPLQRVKQVTSPEPETLQDPQYFCKPLPDLELLFGKNNEPDK